MPTSARKVLGFFGRFADEGIRAPEQNGLSQPALTNEIAYPRLASHLILFFVLLATARGIPDLPRGVGKNNLPNQTSDQAKRQKHHSRVPRSRTNCSKAMTMRLRTVRAAGLLLLPLLALPAAAQAQYIYTTNNGTITLRGYIGPGGVVNIPSTIDGLPDTSIGEDAFFGQSRLTSVTIPNGVTSIGFSAFASCDGLTNVTIPDSVTDIYFEAFSGCASLTSVTIPKSVRHIGFAPFSACSNLTAITVEPLNDSFSSVDGVLFDKSQTTLFRYPGGRTGSYAIPNGVTGIEYKAFTDCNNLSSV